MRDYSYGDKSVLRKIINVRDENVRLFVAVEMSDSAAGMVECIASKTPGPDTKEPSYVCNDPEYIPPTREELSHRRRSTREPSIFYDFFARSVVSICELLSSSTCDTIWCSTTCRKCRHPSCPGVGEEACLDNFSDVVSAGEPLSSAYTLEMTRLLSVRSELDAVFRENILEETEELVAIWASYPNSSPMKPKLLRAITSLLRRAHVAENEIGRKISEMARERAFDNEDTNSENSNKCIIHANPTDDGQLETGDPECQETSGLLKKAIEELSEVGDEPKVATALAILRAMEHGERKAREQLELGIGIVKV